MPREYVGKNVKITVLPAENYVPERKKVHFTDWGISIPKEKKVTFDAISIDTRGYKFDREEANAR
jgi:hypothetical protein